MISFALRCANGHSFDSWFASNAAFEALAAAGHVSCIDCGSAEVRKALMAPAVATDRAAPPAVPDTPAPPRASGPTGSGTTGSGTAASGLPALRALAAMRKHVEENSTWVGKGFAAEVRAIDAGTAPERPIWGEVTGDEARALVEDGLPVAPLPFGPREKAN